MDAPRRHHICAILIPRLYRICIVLVSYLCHIHTRPVPEVCRIALDTAAAFTTVGQTAVRNRFFKQPPSFPAGRGRGLLSRRVLMDGPRTTTFVQY